MKLSFSIEEASNTGNARGMYEGIKQAIGPTVKRLLHLSQNKRDYHRLQETNEEVGETMPAGFCK